MKSLKDLINISIIEEPPLKEGDKPLKAVKATIPELRYIRYFPDHYQDNLSDAEAMFIYNESIKQDMLESMHEREINVIYSISPLLKELKYQANDPSKVALVLALEKKIQTLAGYLRGIK